MSITIADPSLLMLFLLEECNFTCPHCVRFDEPMDRGYRLTRGQLRAALLDGRGLPSVEWVHFSGGEPTLWREGDRDLVDLLVDIADAGFVAGFTTNGSAFEDDEAVERFFRRYLEATTAPLKLYLSVDAFHASYSPDDGRAPCLDSVLRFRGTLPGDAAARLRVNVLVTVSTDPASRLPEPMVRHYESLGAVIALVPLRRAGRARSMADLCLEPERADEKDDRASSLILIGDDYWVVLEGDGEFRDRWRKVGRLGAIPGEIACQYSTVG